jgi:RHS repeat-associated protein
VGARRTVRGARPRRESDGGGVFTYNLRFPGQYFDAETETHYNYFRDYDPSLGRYVQSDPIGLKGGTNTFGYANGNPAGLSDRYGLDVYVQNTTAVNGWHRRIVVDTPNGPYGQSFGLPNTAEDYDGSSAASGDEPGPNKPGTGIVYPDSGRATKEVSRFQLSPEEDAVVERYLKDQLNDTAQYHPITNSCRTYSGREFDRIQDFISRRREGLSP